MGVYYTLRKDSSRSSFPERTSSFHKLLYTIDRRVNEKIYSDRDVLRSLPDKGGKGRAESAGGKILFGFSAYQQFGSGRRGFGNSRTGCGGESRIWLYIRYEVGSTEGRCFGRPRNSKAKKAFFAVSCFFTCSYDAVYGTDAFSFFLTGSFTLSRNSCSYGNAACHYRNAD